MSSLAGQVALVTGGSRGVGRGVALALGDAGMTVYITGRSVADSGVSEAVTARGGRGIPVTCDHLDDEQVRRVLARIEDEAGQLDVLVNNAFKIPADIPMWGVPFWEQPLRLWDDMHQVGLRAHYVASALAAPMMIREGRGLIANISSFAGAGYQLNVAYGVGKAAVDRLARDMAHELAPHGVTALSLWPGIVRTEWLLAQDELPFPTAITESPELTGRVIAALAADPALSERAGGPWVVAELAEGYDLVDVDGTRPPSLRRRPS